MDPKTIHKDTDRIDSIEAAEESLRQSIVESLAELNTKQRMLSKQIDEASKAFEALLLTPIPASDFHAFLCEFIDKLAADGAKSVSGYLNGTVANTRARVGEPRLEPLTYASAEFLCSGSDPTAGTNIASPGNELPPSPIPGGASGGFDQKVMAFLFGNLIKERLGALLEAHPIRYERTVAKPGLPLEERRAAIANTRNAYRELIEKQDELNKTVAKLVAKKRLLGTGSASA